MLTVDPSQKKVVWLLMAILIGAICVTAVRIRPSGVTESANAAATEQAVASGRQVIVQVQNLSRNPFKAPPVYAMAQMRTNAAELGIPVPGGDGKISKAAGKDSTGALPPVQPIVMSAVRSGSKPGVGPEQAKPVFALMATIQSAGSFSAVIKSNDSIVRVVNVGDILEGGYKVRALKADRAVLSNGEDTIVAKKPQS